MLAASKTVIVLLIIASIDGASISGTDSNSSRNKTTVIREHIQSESRHMINSASPKHEDEHTKNRVTNEVKPTVTTEAHGKERKPMINDDRIVFEDENGNFQQNVQEVPRKVNMTNSTNVDLDFRVAITAPEMCGQDEVRVENKCRKKVSLAGDRTALAAPDTCDENEVKSNGKCRAVSEF